MTTKESAEQILSAISKTERGGDFPGVTYERREGCPLGLQEQYEVARDYLRLTDETPVDEAWLRACKIPEFPAQGNFVLGVHLDVARDIDREKRSGLRWFVTVDDRQIAVLETRGQFRMLCAALNIPLQEPTV